MYCKIEKLQDDERRISKAVAVFGAAAIFLMGVCGLVVIANLAEWGPGSRTLQVIVLLIAAAAFAIRAFSFAEDLQIVRRELRRTFGQRHLREHNPSQRDA